MAEREMYLQKRDTVRASHITEDMLKYLQGFYRKNPGNVIFSVNLGAAYFSLGEDQTAEKYFREAWQENHDNNEAFRALVSVYAKQRRGSEMVQIAQEYKVYHFNDQVANEILRSASSFGESPNLAPEQNPVTPSPGTGGRK